MAFKLDKHERERRDGLVSDLNEAWGKLEDAINVYNAEVEKLRAPVNEALAAYNELATEASGYAEDIARRLEDEFDDKSEKWQEGERGQFAASFRDDWQNVAIEELEIEFPDDLSIDAPEHASDLEGLPGEMDE